MDVQYNEISAHQKALKVNDGVTALPRFKVNRSRKQKQHLIMNFKMQKHENFFFLKKARKKYNASLLCHVLEVNITEENICILFL